MSEIGDTNVLDPHLQNLLQAYAITPERRSRSAHRTQSKFMAELDAEFGAATPPVAVSWQDALRDWLARRDLIHPGLLSFIGRRAISYGLMVLVVLVIFLSTGVGMTAYAASFSLPGDALYPLKTTTETVRARWTPDSAAQAGLYLRFARQRLVEMQRLIDEGRYVDLNGAAKEFERDVQASLQAIERVSQQQPGKANRLRMDTVAILQGYSSTLTEMLPSVPAGEQASIQSAIRVAEAAAGSLNAFPMNDDDGNRGGRREADDCHTNPSGQTDEDDCRQSSGQVGGTITQTPLPAGSSSNESNNTGNNDSNNSNNGSDNTGNNSDGGDDDDDDDDDDGDDDDD